jgi:hypothetical protein
VWFLQLTASGGSGSFSYSTDRNLGFQSSTIFQNTGTTVRNGFIRDDLVGNVYAFDVPNFGEWTPLFLPEPVLVSSTGSNGRITATCTGGVPPYRYSLDSASFGSNNDFTGLAPGLHNIRVRDSLDCEFSRDVVVYLVGALNADAVVTVPSCKGSSDGSVLINAQGAVPPYTYSFGGAAAVSTNTFSGRAAGTYSVTVSDSASSSITFDVIVNEPTAIEFDWNLAYGAPGSGLQSKLLVWLSASGGRPAANSFYDVKVNGSSLLVLRTPSSPSSSVPVTLTRYGAVEVQLSDSYGCSATKTVYYFDRRTLVITPFSPLLLTSRAPQPSPLRTLPPYHASDLLMARSKFLRKEEVETSLIVFNQVRHGARRPLSPTSVKVNIGWRFSIMALNLCHLRPSL